MSPPQLSALFSKAKQAASSATRKEGKKKKKQISMI